MGRDADSLKGKLLLWISTSRSTTEPLDGDLGIFNVVRGYVCTRYNLLAFRQHLVTLSINASLSGTNSSISTTPHRVAPGFVALISNNRIIDDKISFFIL